MAAAVAREDAEAGECFLGGVRPVAWHGKEGKTRAQCGGVRQGKTLGCGGGAGERKTRPCPKLSALGCGGGARGGICRRARRSRPVAARAQATVRRRGGAACMQVGGV